MRERRIWTLVALGLVLTATVARFAINFSSSLPPGIDAAYYPLQTRSWLLQGRLMYDDLPLIFWINAAFSKMLIAFGYESDGAFLLASRVVDCIGPPWIAAFVMWIGYEWSRGRRSALAGCTGAALIAILWPPPLTMLSEFQKNSLGLVWLSAAVWACVKAMHRGGWRPWLLVALTLILSVITHVGAFAATAMIAGISVVIWALQNRRHRTQPVTHAARTLTGLAVGAATLAVLFLVFDPRRFRALLTAPLVMIDRGFTWAHRGAGPAATTIVVIVVVAIALYRLWRDRRSVAAGDAGIVIALAVAALVLVGPNDPEYVRRLALMAWVPVAILMTFMLARSAVNGQSRWMGPIFLGLSVLISVVSLLNAERIVERGMLPTDQDAESLIELRDQIPEPEHTLVIATHGHEWWAGFLLHTPVRVVSFAREADNARRLHRIAAESANRYQRVLYLRQLGAAPPQDKMPSELGEGFRRRHTNRGFELYEFEKP